MTKGAPPDEIEGKFDTALEHIIYHEKRPTARANQLIEKMLCLVKWLVYKENESSWKPEAMLEVAAELIQEFHWQNAKMSKP